MKLNIKHRRQKEILTLALFWAPFLIAPLLQLFHVPSLIKYIFDVVWVLILLTMIVKRKHMRKETYIFVGFILVFFFYSLLGFLINYQSIFYYLWGIRNNFRFFVFFLACIFYLKTDNLYECIGWLDKLFYINAVVLFFQFFVLGYKQDYLGGIFGVETGCNGYLNLFLGLMLVKIYVFYQNKKTSPATLIINLVLMLSMAAMAELKYFYVEFVLILAAATICTDFSWRKIIIFVGAPIALLIGYRAIMNIFPDMDLSIEYLFNYAATEKGYTHTNDINRLTFFAIVNRRYLKNGIARLLGLGLGNCDYATGISFLTSPFYLANEQMHYYWLSSSFMYLEMGLLGLLAYLGFFVMNMWFSFRLSKRIDSDGKAFAQIAFLSGIVAILNVFYNISLRVESGYMLYFFLSMPWIFMKAYSSKSKSKFHRT